MLDTISKILTGDMLKALCDMGHGDVLVISDANFPGDSIAQRLIRCPGVDVSAILKAIVNLFPLDIAYTEHPAAVMQLTPGDVARGLPRPESWTDFEGILQPKYPGLKLGEIERFEFYERAKKAFVVIQSGEERIYGNLLLVKGCVL